MMGLYWDAEKQQKKTRKKGPKTKTGCKTCKYGFETFHCENPECLAIAYFSRLCSFDPVIQIHPPFSSLPKVK
jgi:hypothetical protein